MFGLDYVISLLDKNFGVGIQKAKVEVGGLDAAVATSGRTVNKFTNDAKTQMTGLGNAIKPLMGLLFAGFAIHGLSEMVKEGKAAFGAYKMANFQLQASLESTKGVAGKTISELTEQAEKLQHVTLFTAAQTQEAQSLLLTFTDVRNKIFDDAIPAIQNLAAKMSGGGPTDLKGASIQVGKALNDPIKGVMALRRVGVSFNATQIETIEKLVESGKKAKAQALIIKELNKEFGGSAEAARKAKGGYGDYQEQLHHLYMVVGQVAGVIRKILAPSFSQAVHVVTGWAQNLKIAADWVTRNKDVVYGLAIGVGIASGVLMIYNTYMAISAWYTGLSTAAIIINTLVTEGLSAAWAALNLVMEANPIGFIIGAIALLTTGLYIAYQKSATFRAVLAGIGEVAKALVPIFVGLGKVIMGALTFNPALIAEGFKQSVDGVKKIIEKGGITTLFKKGYNASLDESARKEKDKEAEDKRNKAFKPAIGKIPPMDSGKSKDKNESVGGSKSVRNVTVIIQKLIGVEHLTTAHIKEGFASAGDLVKEALIKSVRDSEIAISGE